MIAPSRRLSAAAAMMLAFVAAVFPRGPAHAVSAQPLVAPYAPANTAGLQPVIVVLRPLHYSAGVRDFSLRREMALRAQASVRTDLNRVHASQVRSLWIIDAVSAWVTTGDIAQLRSAPSVETIVPDSPVYMADLPAAMPAKRQARAIVPKTASSCVSISQALQCALKPVVR